MMMAWHKCSLMLTQLLKDRLQMMVRIARSHGPFRCGFAYCLHVFECIEMCTMMGQRAFLLNGTPAVSFQSQEVSSL